MTKLNFSYDEQHDVLTVEGIRYSGDLFRAWGKGGIELNRPFAITERNDGVIAIVDLEADKK